jgi:hypothetical protein
VPVGHLAAERLRHLLGAAGAQLRRVRPGDGQAAGVGRSERRRVAIPSVLVSGHLFPGTLADTVATYRVRG